MEIMFSPAECVSLTFQGLFSKKTLNAFHVFIISNIFYFYITLTVLYV